MRFPWLRPSATVLSLRWPHTLLAAFKMLANERDVSYQSLLKVYLADRTFAGSYASATACPASRAMRCRGPDECRAAARLFSRGGGGEGVLRNAETNRPRLKCVQAAYFACSVRSSPPVSRAFRESVSFPP